MNSLLWVGIPLLALVAGLIIGWFMGHRGKRAVQAEVQLLQKSADAQNEEIARAYAHVQENEERAESLQATNAMLEQQAQTAEEQLANITVQMTHLQQALDTALDARDSMRAQFDAASADYDDLVGQLDAVSLSKRQMRADLAAKTEEATQLAKLVESLRQEAAAERQKPGHAGSDLTEPSTMAMEALAQRDRALETANAEIEALRYSLSSLTAMSAELSATLEERNEAYQALLTRMAEGEPLPTTAEAGAKLSALLAERESALSSVQAIMVALEQELETTARARARLGDFQEQIATLHAELQGTTAAKDETESHLQAREAELEALRGQLNLLKADLGAFTGSIAAIERRAHSQELAWGEMGDRLAALSAELQPFLTEEDLPTAPQEDSETSTWSDLAGHSLARMAAVSEGVTAALAALRQRTDELSEARQGQEQALIGFQTELQAAEGAKAQLQAELAGLNAQIELLEVELPPPETPKEGDGEEAAGVRRVGVPAGAATVAAAATVLHDKIQALADAQTRLAETTALLEAAPAVAVTTRWFTALPESKRAAANAAIAAGVLPRRVLKKQKLADVKRVGKVFEQRLYDHGVGTFWELAHLSDDEARPILDLTDWQLMRLDMNEIRDDALRLAGETNALGAIWEDLEVDDFELIRGVGQVYEQRLHEAGIRTYDRLARSTVEQLAGICRAPRMRTPDYAAWIRQAERLARGH